MASAAKVVHMWRALIDDDRGQDVIEYALLAGLIALVTAPALVALQLALKASYNSWNTATLKCWQMPEPGHGGGC
jgi:Flp pilus assembly pilin Flp